MSIESLRCNFAKHWPSSYRFIAPQLPSAILTTVFCGLFFVFFQVKNSKELTFREQCQYNATAALSAISWNQNIHYELSFCHDYGTLAQLQAGTRFKRIKRSLPWTFSHGYRFTVFPDKRCPYKFQAIASPLIPGVTGRHWFKIDETGIMSWSLTTPKEDGSNWQQPH